jgi:hypothetical protein
MEMADTHAGMFSFTPGCFLMEKFSHTFASIIAIAIVLPDFPRRSGPSTFQDQNSIPQQCACQPMTGRHDVSTLEEVLQCLSWQGSANVSRFDFLSANNSRCDFCQQISA